MSIAQLCLALTPHLLPHTQPMESLPAELLAHILRFVPTARGEAYRSGTGWVACELAGYEDPPPTALPVTVTATWREEEGAQVVLAGDGGGDGSGGGGGGMAAEGYAGLRELAALTCTSRVLRAALSPDIVWAPFPSRLEGRFAAFDPDYEDLWIPAHDGPPLQCTDPERPQTRASQRLLPYVRTSMHPEVTFAKFTDEGGLGFVLKRHVDAGRNRGRSGYFEVSPPYRCPQDCCGAAAGPFGCTTVAAFREHCASPAHRAGLFAHIYNTTLRAYPGMNYMKESKLAEKREAYRCLVARMKKCGWKVVYKQVALGTRGGKGGEVRAEAAAVTGGGSTRRRWGWQGQRRRQTGQCE